MGNIVGGRRWTFRSIASPAMGRAGTQGTMKKWKLDRIISIATLVTSVAALVLVLKKPVPVAAPQTPEQIAANAQSFQQKMDQIEQASQSSQPSQPQSADSVLAADSQTSAGEAAPTSTSPSPSHPAETRLTSDEINAALTQALGAVASDGTGLSPGTDVGSMPAIKDQKVSFDGDLVHGQFLTTIAGKDVWITISGHLGSKEGYATFDPTEFKVGDLNIPVSLVNGPLQRKLEEQRDRLKLPNSIDGVKVDNGELVLQQK